MKWFIIEASKDKDGVIMDQTNIGRYRPEYNIKIIGDNLKKLRKRKSMSVREVADYMREGHVQTVYKWERGGSYPQADKILALMELYDATLEDVVGGSHI